ncbi:MAG TPA: TolC family protein [Puia sp.]|uniref:TolC family protein n=1 Tax=Puia sp. TaxID=2045100 RepID=UPI002BFCE3A2|nr:TolC family protein [Puia sp.]HVU99050.1 TolC family protein [Puia sp.]
MCKPPIAFVLRLLAVLVLPLSFGRAVAQERGSNPRMGDSATLLTQEEAVRAALAGNRQLSQAVLEEKTAGARYRETEAIFLPQVAVSYSAMSTNNPLNAFGFKLQESSITAADFDPSHLNHPGGTPNFLTSLDVRQPIFNADLLYQRKSAEAAIEVYRFRTQRTREGLEFQVRQAYMGLQLAEAAVRVLESSLSIADSFHRFISDRVTQGMLSRADESNAAVRVAAIRSRLAEARSGVRNASDMLALLMGQPAGQRYRVPEELRPSGIPESEDVSAGVAGGMAFSGGRDSVPTGRADLAAMQKAIEAADKGIESTRMSSLPRLNAFGSWQYNDSRMLGFGAHAYLAGVQLSWDIFKGNSVRNKVATQRLVRDKMVSELAGQREEADLQLRRALRQQDDARYAMKESSTAIEAAKESLRILRDRYEQGMTGNTDVLLAQDQLETQQLALVRAVYAYNTAVAYIRFLTVAGTGVKD